MEFLIQFTNIFFNLLTYAIIARILLSWFRASPGGRFSQFLYNTTEPVLRVARRILPPIGMMDFSPILALIVIDILRGLIIKGLISL